MEKKKKFSKANLLYIFSMALGLTIIIVGFSVAGNVKKEMEQQTQIKQTEENMQEKIVKSVWARYLQFKEQIVKV